MQMIMAQETITSMMMMAVGISENELWEKDKQMTSKIVAEMTHLLFGPWFIVVCCC
jgi:hypothetical protein